MSVRLATGRSDTRAATRLLKVQRIIESQRSRGTYIETTPALWGFGSVIPAVFPRATVIHIVRNPVDYVASAVRFRSESHWKGFLGKVVPDLFPSPTYFGINRPLNSMTAVERAAWFWYVSNRHIIESTPGDSCTIRRFYFEEVFGTNNRPETVCNLAHELRIPELRQPAFSTALKGIPVNATRGVSQTDHTSLNPTTAEIRIAVRGWAGSLAERLGYDV